MPKKGRASRTTGRKTSSKPRRSQVKGKSVQLSSVSRTSRKKERQKKQKGNRVKAVKIKRIINKIKSYKMTSKNGINPNLIRASLENIKNLNYQYVGGKLSKNISELLLTKLYGFVKSTKVVRDILETPQKPSDVQGPSLYGCGGGPLPSSGSTSCWFLPDEGTPEGAEMRNSGLVYCWMSLVPCSFKQGNNSGLGVNHEMEHVVPCIGQAFANLLAQRKTLTDDPDKIYRKHHMILKDIIHSILPEKSEAEIKRYVFLIMRMMRRQQVILGLPSISLLNQKKCQLNLIRMIISTDFQIRLETDPVVLKDIIDNIKSPKAHGMTEKEEGKIAFAPCGWAGLQNEKSAFNLEHSKLRDLYSKGYQKPGLAELAARKAVEYKNADQESILTMQCQKICDEYNALANEGISDLVLASSILVLSTIMDATLKDLDVETQETPELYEWCTKAKEILRNNLSKLDDDKIGRFILEKSQELADKSGNKDTENYLFFRDKTISSNLLSGSGEEIRAKMGMAGGAEIDMMSDMSGMDDHTQQPTNKKMEMDDYATPRNRVLPPPSGMTDMNYFEPEDEPEPEDESVSETSMSLDSESIKEDSKLMENLDKVLNELNNIFRNKDANADNPNSGVEENVTLMFSYFEGDIEESNPNFINNLNRNLEDLQENKVNEVYKDLEGLEPIDEMEELEPEPEMAQIRKKTRKRRKKKDTTRKKTGRKKAGQTKKRKRRKTVKKDSLYGHTYLCSPNFKIVISKWISNISCLYSTTTKIQKGTKNK